MPAIADEDGAQVEPPSVELTFCFGASFYCESGNLQRKLLQDSFPPTLRWKCGFDPPPSLHLTAGESDDILPLHWKGG